MSLYACWGYYPEPSPRWIQRLTPHEAKRRRRQLWRPFVAWPLALWRQIQRRLRRRVRLVRVP